MTVQWCGEMAEDVRVGALQAGGEAAARRPPTVAAAAARHGRLRGLPKLEPFKPKEILMPVILWLLGVPLVVVLLLTFLHVI